MADVFELIQGGAATLMTVENLLWLVLGTAIGIVAGSIPGLSSSNTTAILLPTTLGMTTEGALIFIAAIYVGCQYGGSIPAILLRTPGTAGAGATTLDGYPLAASGKADYALGISLTASAFGGFVAACFAILIVGPISKMALKFGPAEIFLLALVGMPVIFALGGEPTTKSLWSVEYTAPLALGLGTVCVLLLLWGSFFAGQKPGDAWRAFFTLCRDSGRAGCDFLKSYGGAAVLLNTACVGLLGLGYILLIGGEVNGPTLGAILTMMGFAACGKHPRNCLPIMVGVWLSTCLTATSPTAHGSQIAALFGTTLAPLSGCFGAPFGVLAGFLHGCVVLRTGAPVAGVNLYNNGFSGGLIATVLYPILTGIFGHRLKGRDVADRL